jgi:hypothetical protein
MSSIIALLYPPLLVIVSFASFAYGYWVWSQWPLHHGRWSVVRMMMLWPLVFVLISIFIAFIACMIDQRFGRVSRHVLIALPCLFGCLGAWIEAKLATRACHRLGLPSVSETFKIPTKNTIRRGLYIGLWLLTVISLLGSVGRHVWYNTGNYIATIFNDVKGPLFLFLLLVSLRWCWTGRWRWGPGGWLTQPPHLGLLAEIKAAGDRVERRRNKATGSM